MLQAEVFKNSMAQLEGLKTEIKRLNKALLQEQGKCKALSDELETPLNVHRCETAVPLHACAALPQQAPPL